MKKDLHQVLPFIDIRRHEERIDHIDREVRSLSYRQMIAETGTIEIHPEPGGIPDEDHVGPATPAGDDGNVPVGGRHAADAFGGCKREIRHEDENRSYPATGQVIVECFIETLFIDTGPGTRVVIRRGAQNTGAAPRPTQGADHITQHDPGKCLPLLLVHDIGEPRLGIYRAKWYDSIYRHNESTGTCLLLVQRGKMRLYFPEIQTAVAVPVMLQFIFMIDAGADDLPVLLLIGGAHPARAVPLAEAEGVSCKPLQDRVELLVIYIQVPAP